MMDIAQNRRSIVRAVAGGVAATAAVAGLVSVGAGTASAAPQGEQFYSKTFTSRYYPTPQSAVIGAEVSLYFFNSQRLNGNQACVEQPNPVVKLDRPVGWTATVTALCLTDVGTGNSAAPVAG
ncbi:hypothetical protein LX12_000952 [Williamsia serinedens]|uniref:Secreted protein n=2 Tax=Williamsia serinedens TaxID=391736 RepID=A0ABT1H211_9NOCA|nr:hypothetical protein [Williamsia serinedens]